MTFFGRHGLHPWEEQVDQPFEVDLEIHLDLQPAGSIDDPSRTVDYSRLYEIARDAVENSRHLLLETLAETLASRILSAAASVEAVTVRVRKPRAALPGATGGVQVEIHRHAQPNAQDT